MISQERVRRTRPAAPEVARVRRTRAGATDDDQRATPILSVADVRLRWVDYKGTKSLYAGQHYIGNVTRTSAPHRGGRAVWVGSVRVPGIVGPVTYSDSQLRAMDEVKKKATEWLNGLLGEAPSHGDDTPTKTRRRR